MEVLKNEVPDDALIYLKGLWDTAIVKTGKEGQAHLQKVKEKLFPAAAIDKVAGRAGTCDLHLGTLRG